MFYNISLIFKEIETKLCNIARVDNITVKLNLRIKQCFNFCILKNCQAHLPDFLGFHLIQEALDGLSVTSYSLKTCRKENFCI